MRQILSHFRGPVIRPKFNVLHVLMQQNNFAISWSLHFVAWEEGWYILFIYGNLGYMLPLVLGAQMFLLSHWNVYLNTDLSVVAWLSYNTLFFSNVEKCSSCSTLLNLCASIDVKGKTNKFDVGLMLNNKPPSFISKINKQDWYKTKKMGWMSNI